ncbi:citrate synthase [Puniceicoccaceae bacterium K14]|nr:citrate synthase [Puniceicoccaceae bacterium K14]
MSQEATLSFDDKTYKFPIFEGTEKERAIDFTKLRSETGLISYDEGFGNTGSCQSKITFIDGEKGILRYGGISIEELAEKSNFLESSYLVMYGKLPTQTELDLFSDRVAENASIDERMRSMFSNYPSKSHPMAILSSMMSSLACYSPELATNDRAADLEGFDEAAAYAISKVRTIAAAAYRASNGLPMIYPKPGVGYCDNFLHMMFSEPYNDFEPIPEVAKALNLMLLLHADHEQNCSTSTVRMVGSGGANLFASVSAGVGALWGPSHGGANMAVIQMLEEIHASGDDGSKFIEDAKSGKSGKRLMGFGHRVYKNFDPRAKIIGSVCEDLLNKMGVSDPCLDIARKLEQSALADDYFVQRKLYPNVDFYSGIVMRAIGIPLNMFTVMFAIGRMPGWLANWKEVASNPKGRISRPRQVYQGATQYAYTPIEERA